jgi:hypothetical protein
MRVRMPGFPLGIEQDQHRPPQLGYASPSRLVARSRGGSPLRGDGGLREGEQRHDVT